MCHPHRHKIFTGLVLCGWHSSQLQGHGVQGAERLCSKIGGTGRTHLERTGMCKLTIDSEMERGPQMSPSSVSGVGLMILGG